MHAAIERHQPARHRSGDITDVLVPSSGTPSDNDRETALSYSEPTSASPDQFRREDDSSRETPSTAVARKVLARFNYNARVVRKAASISPSSETAPRIRSISECWMVARLSVMITESINKPDPFALSLSTRTITLLACPARAHVARDHRHNGLGQACAEAVCLDNQRRPAFRRSQVRVRKQDPNDITASAVHRRQPFQVDPSPRQTELDGAADRRPETRRSHVHEDPPALLDEPTSRPRANLRPPPATPIAPPSRCGRSLRLTSPYTSVSRASRRLVQGG